MSENNLNIDKEWKESVEKEKEALKREGKFTPPEAEFKFFITTLSIQASIALGQLDNPVTNKREEDLSQARFLIDTLGMLKEKTKGNLTPEEEQLIETLLYETRMVYISKIKEKNK